VEHCCGKLLRKIAAENCCGKLLRKIAAENLGGHAEFMRLVKIQAYDRTMADVEISAPNEISAPGKIPASSQNFSGKVWRLLTIWARQNLPLLTSSWSGSRALVQILVDNVDSQTCRPQVI
jgi:hypothetical protein